MIDFEGIIHELFSKGIVIAAVVARKNGQIVYISSNWSVEQADLAECIKKWQARGQFTTLQGIKYSLLMNTAEYFSGINFSERSFLLGAASLDENDRYYIIGYAPPGVEGRSAYVDVVRAANRMKESSSYLDKSAELGKYAASDVVSQAIPQSTSGINLQLVEEVQGFLSWIRDTNGLAGYIQYYLDQNDPNVLKKLAKAYNDFRQVFGF